MNCKPIIRTLKSINPANKKMTLLFTTFLLGIVVTAQIKGAEISVDKDVHDFGTVKQNDLTECFFSITNTGDEPLVLADVKGSCQCTVPEWPKSDIKPGETAKIKVKYNSSRVGPINKTVTITSNAKDNATMTVRIKGTVEAIADVGNPIKDNGGPLEGK
jgi:hypothetical protein